MDGKSAVDRAADAYRAAMAATLAAYRAAKPRDVVDALADMAYDAALVWSKLAGDAVAADNTPATRKASAVADSAIWNALGVGGGKGKR